MASSMFRSVCVRGLLTRAA